MVENLADDDGIFDAGDDLHGAATVRTGFDVDIEDPLQSLGPRHGGVVLGGYAVWCLSRCFLRGFLAAPGWGDQRPVFAVGREDAVETGEVDAGFGYPCGEACNEIHRFEDHVSGAAVPGGFEGVSDLAVFGE